MREHRFMILLMALSMLVAFGFFAGCSDEDDDSPTGPGDGVFTADSEADCEGCHTNEDMLKATVDEDGAAPPPSSGEG